MSGFLHARLSSELIASVADAKPHGGPKPPKPPKKQSPPNIPLIIMDDVGIDQMETFGYGAPTAPAPPNITEIAGEDGCPYSITPLVSIGIRNEHYKIVENSLKNYESPDEPSEDRTFTEFYEVDETVPTPNLDGDTDLDDKALIQAHLGSDCHP